MSTSAGELVELLAEQPPRAGLLSDFDGTLAEIVEDPTKAAPLPGVGELLGSLARRLALVAIVSGRPVGFLTEALGEASRPLVLYGLYGAEYRPPATAGDGDPPALRTVESGAEDVPERWQKALALAVVEVGELPPGTELEIKPSSFALHWRRAPELGNWLRNRGLEIATHHGLETRPAKMAVEIFPPGQSDKGRVVASLTQDLETACFIGDDLGDLAAFRALDELAKSGKRFTRVAVRSKEAPPELIAEADLVVEGPSGVRQLLVAIDQRLSHSQGEGPDHPDEGGRA